jgi:CRP-like cAMP-binding protein
MRTLDILGVNDTFGVLALLLKGHRRTATIQAIEPTETQVLSRIQVDDLRKSGRAIDNFLLELLAQQVERLTSQLTELSEVAAPVRVYRRIVDLAEIFEATRVGGRVPVTQAQVASMAGVKLRVASRVISDARRAGLIDTGWRQLMVLDLPELQKRSRRRT